ncbi:MAG: Uma2 family endonuclease [Acidobacteria bacterium]|nr:Uma2 family endonuclease [Acidobacteriota bacterium]
MKGGPHPTALADLPPEALERVLLSRPEDQWFEKKGPGVALRDLAKALAGMANASGGLVAVGVTETGVPGVDPSLPRVQALVDAAGRLVVPPLRIGSRLVRVPSGHVLLIEVEPGEEVHSLTNDDCYLRVGDETRRLTFAEHRELVYDKGRSFFDARPVRGAHKSDLSLAALSAWARELGARRPLHLAAVRGLASPRGAPTVAGLLVFGRRPTTHLPGAYVRVVRHRGIEARPGRAMAVDGDLRFEGPLPRVVEKSLAAVTAVVPTVERLGRAGRFLREPLYPEFAVREAIFNATVHRSYSLGGDHIRVSMFDDRIEVESPGRLPGLVHEDNIRTTRFARNPHLARVMAELARGREMGEGIERMFREMAAVGLPDPAISQGESSVRVVLLGAPALRDISAVAPGPRGAALTEHLRRFGRVTSRETESLLGVSRATALKRLRGLAELGLLEWVANSVNDPTGFWRLRAGPRKATPRVAVACGCYDRHAMATRPRAKLTYEDYVLFPDDGGRRQLIDGEVYVVPAPSTHHQRIVLRLASALDAHVRAHGEGEIFVAPTDVVLSDTDVVQPDVLFVADDRAGLVTEANIQGAPTLVAEVLSDPALDKRVKRGLYARFGVAEYWILDADADRIEVYRLGPSGYAEPEILEPGDVLTTPLIPGLALDLAELLRRA